MQLHDEYDIKPSFPSIGMLNVLPVVALLHLYLIALSAPVVFIGVPSPPKA